MKKLLAKTELYIRYYITTAILLVVFALAGTGLYHSPIPISNIMAQAGHLFVEISKSMTKTTPQEKSMELMKMEGRRRKNDWKDTHEIFAWNHRFMEEGDDNYKLRDKYRIKQLKTKKRIGTKSCILRRTELVMDAAVGGILLITSIVSYYLTGTVLDKLGAEVLHYLSRHQ